MNSEQLLIQRQKADLGSYTERIHKRMELFPYAYWVTHDFIRNVDYGEGLRCIAGWQRKVCRAYKTHLDIYQGYEPDYTPKRFSAHSVILSEVELDEAELKGWWKHGRHEDSLHVEPYRADGGCIGYIYGGHVADLYKCWCPLTGGCKKTQKRTIRCSHQAGNS